ncbi:Uma2 family endonuclease [Synechococcales cyanobacterium C]|uniref:Uma2 family endonuclease n=1 Tax=Petrachloros mirabilis ULC683 TaxID=2781853 RepID=A0A8K1ZY87_9CYAN|nr:Uma2 family endonuclease [Petrachloros mirabilis]NCJ07500.1 Uma2 family endonuclease [Petrachloros mirabilis ULC683]
MTLARSSNSASILHLENGDRLTQIEFERRYQAMPYLKKAELIEGRVYMPSPVRARKHSKPHGIMIGWLFNYCEVTPGIELMDNPTVRLDENNEPQPDACLRIEAAVGGQSQITEDDYIQGAPELIVEVAASSASYDLHDKKQIYRRHGVREYLVWRVLDTAFDWFVLQEGAYIELPIDADGILRSQVFPGLWLAVNELLLGNLAPVMAGLRLGLASPEYQAFSQSLASKCHEASA